MWVKNQYQNQTSFKGLLNINQTKLANRMGLCCILFQMTCTQVTRRLKHLSWGALTSHERSWSLVSYTTYSHEQVIFNAWGGATAGVTEELPPFIYELQLLKISHPLKLSSEVHSKA